MNYKTYQQNSALWPKSFLNMHDPPKKLFVTGKLPEPDSIKIAIVGSRRPTSYGHQVATQLSQALASRGVVIISGLALGVDGLAHTGAVQAKGKSVAVLPCGIDLVYPSRHQKLAKAILECGGALISEYEPGTSPAKYHFPARNRLIAALSDIVLIVEAGEQSGSLITANLALDHGTTVLAVPGPITSSLSKGTNRLIADGALPVTSTEDLLEMLGLSAARSDQLHLSAPEQRLIDIVSREPLSADQLGSIMGLNGPQLQQIITELELRELVTERAGRIHVNEAP